MLGQKQGRGKGKKPPKVHVSLRVSQAVAKYFWAQKNPTIAIREVLEDYVKRNGG